MRELYSSAYNRQRPIETHSFQRVCSCVFESMGRGVCLCVNQFSVVECVSAVNSWKFPFQLCNNIKRRAKTTTTTSGIQIQTLILTHSLTHIVSEIHVRFNWSFSLSLLHSPIMFLCVSFSAVIFILITEKNTSNKS